MAAGLLTACSQVGRKSCFQHNTAVPKEHLSYPCLSLPQLSRLLRWEYLGKALGICVDFFWLFIQIKYKCHTFSDGSYEEKFSIGKIIIRSHSPSTSPIPTVPYPYWIWERQKESSQHKCGRSDHTCFTKTVNAMRWINGPGVRI
jgi:hypothetical protein